MQQLPLYIQKPNNIVVPFRSQLLKWIGNKQRFSHEIVSAFPPHFNKYFEPFMGSAAVLATLAPRAALGSDVFAPLVEIFIALKSKPDLLKEWYKDRWVIAHSNNKVEGYEIIKNSYNNNPNSADLLYLCRACYGGVVRFRKQDGFMSTPCGVHEPISPASFNKRVDLWHSKVLFTDFAVLHYAEAMQQAKKGDIVYCDPPYVHSQTILYGGQDFQLENLFAEIEKCKKRGVYVALSIDGTKKSGNKICHVDAPHGLFEEELFVNTGRSMLKRFQMSGQTLESEHVADRLLLTYKI